MPGSFQRLVPLDAHQPFRVCQHKGVGGMQPDLVEPLDHGHRRGLRHGPADDGERHVLIFLELSLLGYPSRELIQSHAVWQSRLSQNRVSEYNG